MLNKPNNWFKDRVGKKIYRTAGHCKCSACRRVYEEGLIIEDQEHALYLEIVEGEGQGETIYFDTIEKVREYENTPQTI